MAACLRRLYHLLLHLPRSVAFGRRDHELLDLLELVHAEDSQLVAPVRARLLAEARRVARVLNRQLRRRTRGGLSRGGTPNVDGSPQRASRGGALVGRGGAGAGRGGVGGLGVGVGGRGRGGGGDRDGAARRGAGPGAARRRVRRGACLSLSHSFAW